MIDHRFFKIVTSLFIAVLVMIISVPGPFAAAESSTEKPDHLNIAVVCITVVEQPWITSLIQALERIKAEKPHGLDINWSVAENIYFSDAK